MFSQSLPEYTYAPIQDESGKTSTRVSGAKKQSFRLLCLLNLLLFMISLGIMFRSYTAHSKSSQGIGGARQRHPFFLEDLDETSESIVFRGKFDAPSVYRGQPNSSVDEAWERITNVGAISVSKDYMLSTDQSSSLVTFPNDMGGGYMGTVEVVHQLHCLDLIRKHSYLDYYVKQDPQFYGAAEFRHHVDHCIEMLRQNLMCQSDLGIITYNWVKGYNTPRPDFNTMHQCRNFEKVLGRIKEHQASMQGRMTRNGLTLFQKPADAIELPEAP